MEEKIKRDSKYKPEASPKGFTLSLPRIRDLWRRTASKEAMSAKVSEAATFGAGPSSFRVNGRGAYYDQTVIDTSKGERWFCTEAEAVAAGWRKSKR